MLRGKPIECMASNELVTGSREELPSQQSLNAAPEDGLFHGQKLRKKAERAAEPSPAMSDPLLWFEGAGTQKRQPRAAVEPALTAKVNSSIRRLTSRGRSPANPVLQQVVGGPQQSIPPPEH